MVSWNQIGKYFKNLRVVNYIQGHCILEVKRWGQGCNGETFFDMNKDISSIIVGRKAACTGAVGRSGGGERQRHF